MGSIVEINDTLQITSAQGFPVELDYELHKRNPIQLEMIADKVFEFKDKPGIRIYQAPPVRNFLVENKDGKWLYWGLLHILEITHDYEHKTTSGKYRVIHLNEPDDMLKAHDLIDRNPETKSDK
ncbi:MAG TPA: hypothetical protein VHD38_03690 [Candidatus Paceibacterota bacterium]|jgi:hypothetical protein|nr:hypothetical protein [Candidatus Paceibacterota bacterium]